MAGHRGATARKAEKQSRKRVDSDDASIAALVEEMCVDALAGLPPAKIEEILRPWLAKAETKASAFGDGFKQSSAGRSTTCPPAPATRKTAPFRS